MMKKSLLFYVIFAVSILAWSCSSGDSTEKKNDPGTGTSSGIWSTLKSSSNSTISDSTIQEIISKLSSNESSITMYKGGSSVDILTLSEQYYSKEGYSYVFLVGGLSVSGVSAEDYFNMMKLQAKKDSSFKTSNGYELDSAVTYTVKSESDSKVKYKYEKDTTISNNSVKYQHESIANFIKISNDLYAVVNTLEKSESAAKNDEVASLYSISVISGSSPVSVYLGMQQKANNHGNHKASIDNMVKFFKEDAKRSYNNAKNYTKRKK